MAAEATVLLVIVNMIGFLGKQEISELYGIKDINFVPEASSLIELSVSELIV